MKRLAAIGIMALAVTGSVSAGSIYKCTDAAGNITFSQTACPAKESGDQIGYSQPSRRSPKVERKQQRASKPEIQYQPQIQPDYRLPSPMEQVRQMELEKEKKAIKHRQYEIDAENRRTRLKNEKIIEDNNRITRRKQNKIDRAECDYYKAKARRYEYKDEEMHAYYNLKAAENCR